MGLLTLLGYAPSIVGRKTRDNKLDDPFLKWKVERKKLQDKRGGFRASALSCSSASSGWGRRPMTGRSPPSA